MLRDTTEGPTIRLPRARSIADRLESALAGSNRHDFVQAVKEIRKRELAAIEQRQLDAINEVTGLDIATSLTVLSDEIISSLIDRALAKAAAPTGAWQQLGVFALGGYGRGELSPHSDIDLLVLHEHRGEPEWLTVFNNELQTLLWDVGFQVGASMRSAAELELIIADDFVTATAVLEQRLLQGGERIGATMRSLRERFAKKRAKPFLRYKVAELEERRSKTGANLFVMEPNLKTNAGCLRDIQFLRNIGFVLFGSRNLHALRELETISFQDVQGLFSANDHILSMRALLHFHHDRREDHLRLPDQLHIADILGYETGRRFQAAEQMMQGYYDDVLHVHQTVDLAVARLHALGHLGRRRLLIKSRKKVDDDVVAIDNQIYIANKQFWQHHAVGLRLLEICRLAQERQYGLAVETQRSIKEHLYLLDNNAWRETPAAAEVFAQILADYGKLRYILEDMHWSGLLGAYLPEFANLRALLQFNSYHQYTVDEHTLIALGQLDRLHKRQDGGFEGMGAIMRSLSLRERTLLALSLILHDVGKFMGSGHVARGALMVHPVARRLHLDESEEDLVHFLVLEHVTLSDATRTRDIQDPAFLDALASSMGSQKRLDLLYVLTWCDMTAVADDILTGWQAALMNELYAAVASAIRRKTGGDQPSNRQLVREALEEAGVVGEAMEAHLERLPANYLFQADPRDVALHHHLFERAASGEICIEHQLHSNETATVLCSLSYRTGMFADLTAALSASNLDIVEARTWGTTDRLLLFQFRVSSQAAGRLENETMWQRLAANMRAVAKGEIEAARLLEQRQELLGIDKPADSVFDGIEVRLDNTTSQHATIIDIRVKDSPGLLHVIGKTCTLNACRIMYASISTYGDVARDVFYLLHEGRKLDARKASQIRKAIDDQLQIIARHPV